jgi:glutamate--cysteine ligase
VNRIEEGLSALGPAMLRDLKRGIEKESLRVRADGSLAETPHPAGLGSPLTHPYITTDFSEAQLELITGVHPTVEACLAELTAIHQVVYRNLGDEMLWCASMPCKLPPEDRIPLGRYGRANIGRLKTAYRSGLSHRYGRRMQTISGIHYNFSLPDEAWPSLQRLAGDRGSAERYQDVGYFALIRNFRRHAWLLMLLIGSSPAVCGSFLGGRPHRLTAWGTGTFIAPYGTTLRMGKLGYQSDAQSGLATSFNSLAGYARALHRGLTESYPPYEAIGLVDEHGNYRQIATTLLQIENEFYGKIRPKRRIRPLERPLHALGERGVEYVEARLVDVNPYDPVGIDAPAMRVLDVFLLHCLLAPSPPDTPEEIAAIARNQQLVAEQGRDPALRLERGEEEIAPRQWAHALLAQCEPIAEALDAALGGTKYAHALAGAAAAIDDMARLPSARSLAEMETSYGRSFPPFAVAYSQRHRDELTRLPLAADIRDKFERMAAESNEARERVEAADDLPFETFRQRYLAQDMLSGAHFRDD